MKKIIFIILLLLPLLSKAQDSLWITSLQLRVGTIKLLAARALNSGDTSILKVFYKWRTEFIDNPPANDNANVTIDSAKTIVVAWMYENILNLPAGLTEVNAFINDFTTSIQSKRSANSYLDALCDNLEATYIAQFADLKAVGNGFLTNQ